MRGAKRTAATYPSPAAEGGPRRGDLGASAWRGAMDKAAHGDDLRARIAGGKGGMRLDSLPL